MNKRKFQIKLTYFKPSGKYYSEGECEVEAGEIVAGEGTPQAYSMAYTYDVLDAVALMDKHPGLVGRWTEGPILVTGPEMSPPHLITDLEGLARRAQKNLAEARSYNALCEMYRPELDPEPGTLGQCTDDNYLRLPDITPSSEVTMSEVQPQAPEVMIPLNTLSIPLAVLLMDGKDKPDGLGLSKFLGYAHLPKSSRPMRVIDTVRVFDPESIMASGGFYIKWLHDNGATLPYRYWADRLALTAAWVIEHSGLSRPAKVQSAIVFRETRTTETVWKVCPDGDHLTIQVVHGPRAHTSVRWRISDGMEVTNYGVPLRNQSLRLPNLHFQVEVNTTPEAALLEALHGAGFVMVATEENAPT